MRPAERIRLDMDSLHKHISTQPPSGGAWDVSNRGWTALPISLEQPRTWQTTPLTHGAVHLRGFLYHPSRETSFTELLRPQRRQCTPQSTTLVITGAGDDG
ncbi:hypothetical protein NEUTE1DRAFT_101691 [Neurospora tetrasperma FGSC 2508]|uniref:Uncharacterized protein n=1 Tax=Neurospora tetrasperma (strain FGSC 2508 / ATCC MYA-4615 / P0657) TaxID=510951 RepID=F8MPY1_NEUT8|nr:uncharacterized protein NEUTE1DRAFT_101691 [Neurospora tetrasperma FGSC 2508]EGO56411.1 hypothetical protein NEUTE1DRAFT_101691 [Neurospora tetrasperma FGSC 2508]EGZ70728.1 hypothetical protein NEUTE2DRAFT_130735 [Neurospora tetrasperma FGSC 2509]